MILNIVLALIIGVAGFSEAGNLIRVRRWKGDSGDDQSSLFRGTAGVDYPNYKSIPVTSFKCSDYSYPAGLYADVEAQCQVYHVCHEGRKESFLCGKGTIFNQQILTCDYWYSTECNTAPNYYYLNEQIGDIQTRLQGAAGIQGIGPAYQTSNDGTTQYKPGTAVQVTQRNQVSGSIYKPQKPGQYQPDNLSGQYIPQAIPGGSGQYNPQSGTGDSGQYYPQNLPGDSGQYNPQSLPGDSGQYNPQYLPGDSGQYYPANLPGDSGQYYGGRTSSVTGHQFKGSVYVPGRSPAGSGQGSSTGQTRPGSQIGPGSLAQIAPGGHSPTGQTSPGNLAQAGQTQPGSQGGYVRQTTFSGQSHVRQTTLVSQGHAGSPIPGSQGVTIRQTRPGSALSVQTRPGSYGPGGQTRSSSHIAPGSPEGQYRSGSPVTKTGCQNDASGLGTQCQPDGQDIYILAVWSANGQSGAGGQQPGTKDNIYSDHYPKPPGSKLDKGPVSSGIQYPQPQGNVYQTGQQSAAVSGTGVAQGLPSPSVGTTHSQRPQAGPWSFPSGGMMMMGGPGDR